MQRDGFLFYRSYFESIQQLEPEDRQLIYDAICQYALYGKEIELSGAPAAILLLIKPTLDASRKKAENGRKGGQSKSKPQANDKQTESKPEPKPKPKQRRASQLSAEQLSLFEKFYSAYPKKTDRGTAERAWAKINPDSDMTEKIVEAVEKAKRYDSRFREKQYIPNPASWLNAKGYMNEYGTEGGDSHEQADPNKRGPTDWRNFKPSGGFKGTE